MSRLSADAQAVRFDLLLSCAFIVIHVHRIGSGVWQVALCLHEGSVVVFEPANRWSFYRQGILTAIGSRLTTCRPVIKSTCA